MNIDRAEHQLGLMDLEVDVSLVKGKSEVGDEEGDFMLVKVDNDEKDRLNAVNLRITPDNGLCDVKVGLSDFRDDEYGPKASIGTHSDALETKSGVLEHLVLRTGDVSLVKGKSEVGDEEGGFMLVKVDNDEKDRLNAVNHRITPDNGLCDVKVGLSDFRDDEYGPKASIGTSSDALDTKSGVLEHLVLRAGQEVVSAKCSAPVYQSLMTEFDEYVANEKFSQNGTSRALRYGLEVGDMVWGKVKSHPWWPGHIFNEALASSSARRVRGDGSVLVAFFGDSSYGWFDPAELIPFDANFADKLKQTTSKNFAKAVEEAVDETSRRSALGLVCNCQSKFNFRPANVQGYYSVEVPDYELEGFYSTAQIKKSRDNFVPSETLSFVQKLALTPQSSDETNLGFIKHRAISFAYRKAVFEEFDETYAQAFGGSAIIASHDTYGAKDQSIKVLSRAPLSGPLVIAEALGGVKETPSKPIKVKDQSKKDKYLFKRRDELNTGSSVPAAYVQSSFAAVAATDGGFVLQKRPPSVPLNPGPLTTSGPEVVFISNGDTPLTNKKISLEKIGSFQGSMEKLGVKGTALGIYRVEDGNGDRVVVKKKKFAKQPVKEVGIDPVTGEKRHKKKRKELSLEAGTEQPPQKRLATGKIRPTTTAQLDPALKTDFGLKKDEGSVSNVELPQLLSGLQLLALDHFHVPKKVSSAVVRQSFLRFRSVVYQKSLVLSPSAEQDSIVDVPTTKSLSVNRAPLDRKRGPSNRQEEIGAKRLKNMDKIKSLSDKKLVVRKLKETAAPQEKIVKKLPPQQEKIVKRSLPQQQPQPKKAAIPTMLIMKFPPQTSLPSVAELKARFARFGPLDYSSLRVFWKSSTCRVVFQQKPDAVSAYKYAVGTGSLFGNVNVRYFVREVEQELESTEMPAQTTEFDRPVPFQPVMQPPVQLKSCLKKPGEEAGPTKARVKFILGGEESPNSARISNPNNSREVSASFADVVSSTPTITPTGPGLVVNSKIFQKSTVLPSLLSLPSKFQKNGGHQTPLTRPSIDISQQMISLLNRCNDVVANLTGILGYVPYHPL